MANTSNIELTTGQVDVLYDLVEHRLTSAPTAQEIMPELEIDELLALAGVLVKLRYTRDRNE